MRFLAPDELPPPAAEAVAASLAERGEDSREWRVSHVWENGQRPAGYAVCVVNGDDRRSFTVVPREGSTVRFEAWDVTSV